MVSWDASGNGCFQPPLSDLQAKRVDGETFARRAPLVARTFKRNRPPTDTNFWDAEKKAPGGVGHVFWFIFGMRVPTAAGGESFRFLADSDDVHIEYTGRTHNCEHLTLVAGSHREDMPSAVWSSRGSRGRRPGSASSGGAGAPRHNGKGGQKLKYRAPNAMIKPQPPAAHKNLPLGDAGAIPPHLHSYDTIPLPQHFAAPAAEPEHRTNAPSPFDALSAAVAAHSMGGPPLYTSMASVEGSKSYADEQGVQDMYRRQRSASRMSNQDRHDHDSDYSQHDFGGGSLH